MLKKMMSVFGRGESIPRETESPEEEPKSYTAPSADAASDAPAETEAAAETTPEAPPRESDVIDVPDSPLREPIVDALKSVYDPEIPVDIWELGLIYVVRIDEEGKVHVDMTLTSPNCPSAEELPGDAEKKIRAVEGVTDVKVDVVWEPIWDKDKMSEVAKLELGMD